MSRDKLIAWGIFAFGVAMVALYYVMTVPGAAPEVLTEQVGTTGGPQIEITIAGEGANGAVVVELFDTLAPRHVERILTLAREGAYDGVVFHRVIDGFMAQTGDVQNGRVGADLRLAGTGGSAYPDLPAEFSKEPFVAGVLGMARSQSPDSANSQFFIMFAPAEHLNGQYTVVGRVVSGIDVVNAIKRGAGSNGEVVGAPDVMASVRVVD